MTQSVYKGCPCKSTPGIGFKTPARSLSPSSFGSNLISPCERAKACSTWSETGLSLGFKPPARPHLAHRADPGGGKHDEYAATDLAGRLLVVPGPRPLLVQVGRRHAPLAGVRDTSFRYSVLP